MKTKNYSLSDGTQRRPWENLRDLRDVSDETSLTNLQQDVSEICKSALFETSLRRLWDAVWDVSEMHLRCIHARWDVSRYINKKKKVPQRILKIKLFINKCNWKEIIFFIRKRWLEKIWNKTDVTIAPNVFMLNIYVNIYIYIYMYIYIYIYIFNIYIHVYIYMYIYIYMLYIYIYIYI